jgi:tetratricopeptide (TPR) repeat protein
MELRRVIRLCFFLFLSGGLYGQDFSGVADQYVRWAGEAIAAGRWNEALAGLERGADYADLSSDLSYLLALARSRNHRPLGAVLEALRRAGETGRWNLCSPDQALILEAETLITLRNFSAALNLLAGAPENADAAVLRLRALRGLSAAGEFRRAMEAALEQYPRDPRPALIFFEYAREASPEGGDPALMNRVLGRLPYLVEAEPRLAFLAAPFIKDRDEARRLLGAYRGVNRPLPQSIPAGLSLGLIDEAAAVEEFFSGDGGEQVFDRDLVREIFSLLRNEAARRLFRERLFRFSGLLTADDDRDGFPESRVRYRDGSPEEYSRDADQDGLPELRVFFDAGGGPQWAEQVVLPRAAEEFALPVRDEDRIKILVLWERYPGVLRSELEGITYIPGPGEFLFSPLRLSALAEDGAGPGLPFPVYDPLNGGISRRALGASAITIQRPSAEFEGAVEWIDLRRGVPLRAAEILEGRPVSVTEFNRGKPVSQRIDLDVDGRMETIRRFRDQAAFSAEEGLPELEKILEFSESDWDGDGIFETGEQYLLDGTVVYSWDMDGDGVREYSEIRNRE